MAHRTTNRRILAASQDSPPNPSAMDPTLKKSTKKPTSAYPPTKNPDHLVPSKPFYMSNPLSKLNPVRRIAQKPTRNYLVDHVDTHLQAKAMTVSADFDSSSRLSIIKQKHQQQLERFESRIEKESIKEATASKDKVKRLLSNKELGVVNKKKVQENEKKKKDNRSKEVKDLIEGLDIKRMTVSLDGGVGGGRRRSLCGSQVELADFLANNGAKIVSVDMPPFMQIHAVDCARKTHDSLEKFTSKTLALTLKKEFDGIYGPAWHCIVGTSFGSFVTHSVGGFLYFSMDQKLYVLLFKTTVQRAD
ncbi:uncharacterized protein LOC8283253 [Ricinus communis]|uniref:Axonemal dynein light chain, putative n=1 Tax=Ricinus communis TaxID=3988 RepID=B9S757_RICCO|nr:uncharacterized protein LOC8283253 [Ricinus communis]EEF40636.1 axonemal dynein light chain, putative [Ricinus communis]|eukprot:XP_002521826.1 uncharacterized protein LOC8283253 [Ricinus communis]